MRVLKYIAPLIILVVTIAVIREASGEAKVVGAVAKGQATIESRDVIVAILDTGIDGGHQELSGKIAAEVNFTASPTSGDLYGHGTHVAGIVARSDDTNAAGLAPRFQLLNVKVADDQGRCEAEAVAKGIVWAVDRRANVINISLELTESSESLLEAIEYAWNHGAIIIAASGNDGNSQPTYPAAYGRSIAVAAIMEDDRLVPLSNYGDWIDVAAAGFNIYSILPDNSYGYKTGTSFAAAAVSRLAGLLYAVATDKNGDGRLNDEVRTAIENGSRRIVTVGTGRGRVDLLGSLTAIGYMP